MNLADTECKYVGRQAWGDVTREQPLPHITRLDTIEEQASELASFLDALDRHFVDRARLTRVAGLKPSEE